MNFIGTLNRGKFNQATVLKFGCLLGGGKLARTAKCQHNISKTTPTRPKNTCQWVWIPLKLLELW